MWARRVAACRGSCPSCQLGCPGVIEACEATGHLRHSVHMPNAQSPVAAAAGLTEMGLVHQAQPATLLKVSKAGVELYHVCKRGTWVGMAKD